MICSGKSLEGVNLPETEKCVAYNTADRTWRSEESLGIRHGDVVYSLPSWILVCDPTLPHFAAFPSF